MALKSINHNQNVANQPAKLVALKVTEDIHSNSTPSVKSSASVTPTIEKTCNQQCRTDVEKFRTWARNINWSSEEGDDRAGEYAAYIQERPNLRDRLISMAGNQSENDFNQLLVASFRYLEADDKMNLSQALMESSAWGVRRNTISLLTSQDVLATQDEANIASLISAETDPRVAVPILQALGQSDIVLQKPAIMKYINERVSYTQNSQIRGAALVAQTRLTLDDVTTLPVAVLDSLQSQDHAYTAYGIQAADLILAKLYSSKAGIETPLFQEAQRTLNDLIYADPAVLPKSVLRRTEDLYFRYFE